MSGVAFNPEMLVLAREQSGLTQTDFAELVALSQSDISKFETGLRIPTPAQTDRMAGALGFLPEFFFQGEAYRGFTSPCTYHRKRESTREKVFKRLLADINVRRIQIQRLLRACELTAPNRFLRLDLDDHAGDVGRVARLIRATWQLPPGPVQNLVRSIEDHGGIVIPCEFQSTSVDAVSQWVPTSPPLFFVNASIATDRIRFTLAHEIGHIVLHDVPTDDMEREADRFASEFLMPEREIRPYLSGLTLARLAQLKPYWRVSMQALLKRAGDLHVISKTESSRLWKQLSAAGFRRAEPVQIPPETPAALRQILRVHSERLGLSRTELNEVLFLPRDRDTAFVSEFSPPPAQGLRIVR